MTDEAPGLASPSRGALAAGIIVAVAAVAVAIGASIDADDAQCGPGFAPGGARCLASGATCPPPLILTDQGCDAPLTRVAVKETTLAVGASDWEAEGRVAARSVRVGAFELDAFEVTLGAFACPRCPFAKGSPIPPRDVARAASSVTRDEAARFCASRAGRLPTEDEWMAAAAGDPPRRYPWGDTGAVCRRAAWGLAAGPCSNKGTGPDTVGAHLEGATAAGVHDLAGNVAEWVDAKPAVAEDRGALGVVRGGSWRSALATDLRTWARQERDPSVRDEGIGVRCAYDVAARGPAP